MSRPLCGRCSAWHVSSDSKTKCLFDSTSMEIYAICTFGGPSMHAIYQIGTQGTYLGRCSLCRLRRNHISGACCRWLPHVRDLGKHRNHVADKRHARTRYHLPVKRSSRDLSLSWDVARCVATELALGVEAAVLHCAMPEANNASNASGSFALALFGKSESSDRYMIMLSRNECDRRRAVRTSERV